MNLESPKKRLIVGIILLLALTGLCTHYASQYEKHLKYPSYGAILSDYPQGELVNVGGTVIRIDDDGFLIKENYHGQIVTMKILTGNFGTKITNKSQDKTNKSEDESTLKNTPITVKDKVSVVGVLGPDNQMVSVQEIEVNEYQNYIFLLLRSFLALFFLIYIFNRYWCFNWETFEFRRR